MPEATDIRMQRSLSTYAEVDASIDHILAIGTRRIQIFERLLTGTWDRPSRIATLNAFCAASRRNEMRIVVHDELSVQRHCPRLVALMGRFTHVIAVRQTRPDSPHATDPLLLVDDRHYVHRFHFDSPRSGCGTNDPEGIAPLLDRFAQIWEAADPTSQTRALGL